MKKIITAGLTLIMVLSLLTGCGNLQSKESTGSGGNGTAAKVLKFGQANAASGLDMQKSTSSNSASIADSVTESLLRFDDNNNEEVVLLNDFPKISEDGTTYAFELKQGVHFTNGTELTSKDVKFTFERMFTPATGATSYGYFSMIKGATAMLNGETTELSGFEIVDDYHFVITLDYAYAPFLKNIGTSYADIFPKDACTAAGSKWGVGTDLIGTGPYKIQSNDDTTEVVLVKNENYHGGSVNLDELHIKYYDDTTTKLLAYESGEIDLCDLPADLLSQYITKYADQITTYYPLGTAFISLKLTSDYIKDTSVRKAISLAINREELVSTVLNGSGIAAKSYLNPNIPGHDGTRSVYEYNPEEAKKLLREAGYTTPITITADVRQADQTVFAAIQGYLDAVGITMKLNVVDNATWNSERTNGTVQLTGMTWNALYPDADFQMYNYFYSTKSNGKGVFYRNPEFDQLLDSARAQTDEKQREELYKKADTILSLNEYACIPLYYPQSQFVAKSYVKNMTVGNLIYHFWNVDIDTTAQSSTK